jgi:hypothetical protein
LKFLIIRRNGKILEQIKNGNKYLIFSNENVNSTSTIEDIGTFTPATVRCGCRYIESPCNFLHAATNPECHCPFHSLLFLYEILNTVH